MSEKQPFLSERHSRNKWLWTWYETINGVQVPRTKIVCSMSFSRDYAMREVGKLSLPLAAITPAVLPSLKILVDNYRNSEKFLACKPSTQATVTHYLKVIETQFGDTVASAVSSEAVSEWLRSSKMGEAAKSKTKIIIGSIFKNAKLPNPCAELKYNVRPINNILRLTAEETCSVLAQMEGAPLLLTTLIASTGLRVSEALGLRWTNLVSETNEIYVTDVWVMGGMQSGTKTAASADPVPMPPTLFRLLTEYRKTAKYNGDDDYIFASAKEKGKQPLYPGMLIRSYLRPAMLAAKVIRYRDGKLVGKGGREIGRIGFHCLRHSLASSLMATSSPAVVQGVLRHSNMKMSLYYGKAGQGERLTAVDGHLQKILPKVA